MVGLKYDFNRLKNEKLHSAVTADTGITRSMFGQSANLAEKNLSSRNHLQKLGNTSDRRYVFLLVLSSNAVENL